MASKASSGFWIPLTRLSSAKSKGIVSSTEIKVTERAECIGDQSWQGSDEGDDVSGRGWAGLNPDGRLEGHIYFHLGDDSAFRAERFNGAVQ